MNSITLRHWFKTSEHPGARFVRSIRILLINFELPSLGLIARILYSVHCFIIQCISHLLRIFYYTPLFKSRLCSSAKNLYLYGGMPVVMGSLKIKIGTNVELAARTTMTGRTLTQPIPELRVGDDVVIGWQSKLSAGKRIIIKDKCYLAGGVHLAGYPGHSIDPQQRAERLPDNDEQIGDIILEENVWLGSNVTVLSGVTIGENTVVGAGSVVTKSLPANVMAAGVPAKVIKSI